jgi:sugar phosphate isomerase/epimerase
MQLCLDATRFGFGLEEAIELAYARGMPAVSFTFQPFTTARAASGDLSASERKYLKSVKELACARGVSIACLQLDYCLGVGVEKSRLKFDKMIAKLSQVAGALGAAALSFFLEPLRADQAGALESSIVPALQLCALQNVKLLLRLSTPMCFRGQSLAAWTPTSPQTWRDILAACPGLLLSFSPADCAWQGIDYLSLVGQLAPAIGCVEAMDFEVNRSLIADSGLFGPLWWRYRLPGKGQLDWRQLVEALKLYDFNGPISIDLADEFVPDDQAELALALETSLDVLAPLLRG